MEHTDAGTRVTEPRDEAALDGTAPDGTALDETLARAIRLLISEAIESRTAPGPSC